MRILLGLIVLAVTALLSWRRPERTIPAVEAVPPLSPVNDRQNSLPQGGSDRAAGEHAPQLRTLVIVLSFIASAFAVVFTLHQVDVSRQAMMAQAWQNLMHPGYEISQAFLDFPELRPYFYEGKACPATDVNYHRVMVVCEMHLDFFDSFTDDYVYKLPDMARGAKSRILWDNYFRDTFATSPALRQYARNQQDWYSMDFTQYFGPEDEAELAAPSPLLPQ